MPQNDGPQSKGFIERLRERPFIAGAILLGSTITGVLTWMTNTLDSWRRVETLFGIRDPAHNQKLLRSYILGKDIADISFSETIQAQDKPQNHLVNTSIQQSDYSVSAQFLEAAQIIDLLGIKLNLKDVDLSFPNGFDMNSSKNFSVESTEGVRSLFGTIHLSQGREAADAFLVGYNMGTWSMFAKLGRFPHSRYGFGIAPEIDADLDVGRDIGFPVFDDLSSVNPDSVSSALGAFDRRVYEKFDR